MASYTIFIGGTGNDIARAAFDQGFDLDGLYIDTEDRSDIVDGKDVLTGLQCHRIQANLKGDQVVPDAWRDLLLSQQEQAHRLETGFFANPKLGSLALSNNAGNRLLALQTRLNTVYAASGRPQEVRVIGSLFGGTGTALMPHVISVLQNIVVHNCVLEVFAILPWFVTAKGADDQFRRQNVLPTLALLENKLQNFTDGSRVGRLVEVDRDFQAHLTSTAADNGKGYMDPWIRAVAYRIFMQTMLGVGADVIDPRAAQYLHLHFPSERTGTGGIAAHAAALEAVLSFNIPNAASWLSRSNLPTFLADVVHFYKAAPGHKLAGKSKKPSLREFLCQIEAEIREQGRRLANACSEGASTSSFDPAQVIENLSVAAPPKFRQRFEAIVNGPHPERAASLVVAEVTTMLFNGTTAYFNPADPQQDMYNQPIATRSDDFSYMSTSMSEPLSLPTIIATAAMSPQRARPYQDILRNLWLALLSGLLEFRTEDTMDQQVRALDPVGAPARPRHELLDFAYMDNVGVMHRGAVGYTDAMLGLVPATPLVDRAVQNAWNLGVGDYRFETPPDLAVLWTQLEYTLMQNGMLVRAGSVVSPSPTGTFALKRLMDILAQAPTDVPAAQVVRTILGADLGPAPQRVELAEIAGCPAYMKQGRVMCLPMFVPPIWQAILHQAKTSRQMNLKLDNTELTYGDYTLARVGQFTPLLGTVLTPSPHLICINTTGMAAALKHYPNLAKDLNCQHGHGRWI